MPRPVVDVDARPGPSTTNPDGARSFSGDPAIAAAYSVAFMEGLSDAGVLPVVKHFPGLGGSSGNTDSGPASTEPLAGLRSSALVPFRAAVQAGAPAVMVANASVPGLTRSPSSLSAAVTTDLLGGELGFHGLVVTDSLSAGAILTPAERAHLSASGVRRSFDTIVTALVAAVADGRLPLIRLQAAALHVALAAHDQLCP